MPERIEYDPRRPRLPADLARLVDDVRVSDAGEIPFDQAVRALIKMGVEAMLDRAGDAIARAGGLPPGGARAATVRSSDEAKARVTARPKGK